MKTIFLLIAIFRFVTTASVGSSEIPLPISSVDVKGWTEMSGGVRIQIESPKGAIESVKISAFGRDIEIPDAELAKLKKHALMYSDVCISHEGGYKEGGGHTIYFTLKFRDTFGGDPFEGAPELEQRVRISVPQNAPVKVQIERVKPKE